jgi:predicted O-linked N-acetylglucosamine transferase (SPINDLY family)
VRLPRLHFTYRPPDDAPPVSPPPASRTGVVTLGSFNNPAKIGRETISAWAAAMDAVPGSRLVLKWRSLADAESAQRVRRRFAMRGIDPARIDVRGASPHATMLAEYGDVDIALDPFPYGGGLTTCEALWMGVPVVTMPWLRPLSRQSLAVLQATGLGDLVARTPREFAATVARLAAAGERRAALRAGLRDRLRASALFDGRSLAAALERAYASAIASREAS